jgi:hypothetical protein
LLEHARRVAEAQFDSQRIKRARHEIFALMDPNGTLGTHLRKLGFWIATNDELVLVAKGR